MQGEQRLGHHEVNEKKSRSHNFNRTQMARSRIQEDYDRQPLGIQRKAFNKSALMSGSRKDDPRNNLTIEEVTSQAIAYKRNSAHAQSNTVRVQSHSQPPSAVIPPPSKENPVLTIKRPLVKLAGIHFNQSNAQASNNSQTPVMQFYTNPSSIGKKQSTQISDASPYMTQQKVVTGQNQNKRVIHLKRPSTNINVSTHGNMPIGKPTFTQRAVSRVEQLDKTHELSFNTSGKSDPVSNYRQTSAVRIGKKTSISQSQNKQMIQVMLGSKNNALLRPQSDFSDRSIS